LRALFAILQDSRQEFFHKKFRSISGTKNPSDLHDSQQDRRAGLIDGIIGIFNGLDFPFLSHISLC
jgi:hypothetical protein